MTISLISKKQELTENLIKCYEEHLEQLNEMLAQSQKEDREMIDFVRAKKVRSETEEKTFTDDFKSQITKDILSEIDRTEQDIKKLIA